MEVPRAAVDLNILQKINNFTKKPEIFLGVQENVAKELTFLLKSVYDFTKTAEPRQTSSEALPELIIQDFDEEQIWQELELQNDFKVNAILCDVATLVSQKEKLALSLFTDTDDKEDEKAEEDNIDEWNIDNVSDNGEDFDYEVEKHKSAPKAITKPKKLIKKSVVDDKFFKLDELNAFLEQEDRKDAAARNGNDKSKDEEDLDNYAIDLFEDISGDEDTLPKYSDFFAAPYNNEEIDETNFQVDEEDDEDMDGEENDDDDFREEDEEQPDDDNNDEEHFSSEADGFDGNKKKVRFDLSIDNNDEIKNDKSNLSEPEFNGTKSHYEICQDRLRNKIGHLEAAAMSEKPWQLKGEVSSTSRPQNSLLEEVVDFQMTTRPAPIITEITTLSLEKMILQRVASKQWNDVKRKVKGPGLTKTFQKALVLNEEKSKVGLADVYEQDYKAKLSKEQAMTTENNVEIERFKKIRQQLDSLFAKLDALGNYHFMPKPVAPELRIITNVPAINMEEVAPVATTSASLLAPEEVKAKRKGDLMGKEERTSTDKKRERRHKKAMQRDFAKNETKKASLFTNNVPGFKSKLNKKKQEKLLKDVIKSKKVSKMTLMKGVKVTKSSTSFFSQLQDKVKNVTTMTNVVAKKANKPNKPKKGKSQRDHSKVSSRQRKLIE